MHLHARLGALHLPITPAVHTRLRTLTQGVSGTDCILHTYLLRTHTPYIKHTQTANTQVRQDRRTDNGLHTRTRSRNGFRHAHTHTHKHKPHTVTFTHTHTYLRAYMQGQQKRQDNRQEKGSGVMSGTRWWLQ
jgi:prophage tail gpP-like protein